MKKSKILVKKDDDRRMGGWEGRKMGLEEGGNKRVSKCSHVLPALSILQERSEEMKA